MPKRKRNLRADATRAFSNFEYTAENAKNLSPQMKRALEKSTRLIGLFMINPLKLYSNPVIASRLRAYTLQKDREEILRTNIKHLVLASLQSPARARRANRLTFDYTKMNAIIKRVGELGEWQLLEILRQSKKMKGKRFESFILSPHPGGTKWKQLEFELK